MLSVIVIHVQASKTDSNQYKYNCNPQYALTECNVLFSEYSLLSLNFIKCSLEFSLHETNMDLA